MTNMLQCVQCNEEFTSAELMISHVEEQHSNRTVNKIECDLCDKTFSSQEGLRDHVLLII